MGAQKKRDAPFTERNFIHLKKGTKKKSLMINNDN